MDDAAWSTHVIRLHAAWQRTERVNDAVIATQRLTLPDTIPVDASATSLVYVRKFHAPTGLQPPQRVCFVCELLRSSQSAELNGVRLDLSMHPASIDITEHLNHHNVISLWLPIKAIDVARTATATLMIASTAAAL